MKHDLLQRLRTFAERSRPEWQIVLMTQGRQDLTLTRQDLLDILDLADPRPLFGWRSKS